MQKSTFRTVFLERISKPLEKTEKKTERYHRRNADGYAVEGVKGKIRQQASTECAKPVRGPPLDA